MPSLLGHGLAGMSVWALARRAPFARERKSAGWYALAAGLSAVPDIDSLVGLSHRGPTHALGFALAAGAVVAGAASLSLRKSCLWMFPVFTLVTWLHPIFDLLTGGGPRVALFWPISAVMLTPVEGGLPLHWFTYEAGGLVSILGDPTPWVGVGYEAAIFGPLFAATLVRRRAAAAGLAALGAAVWLGGLFVWRAPSVV